MTLTEMTVFVLAVVVIITPAFLSHLFCGYPGQL